MGCIPNVDPRYFVGALTLFRLGGGGGVGRVFDATPI